MDRLQLSAAQKQSFATFGFLALPGLLKDVIGEIIEAFEQVWPRCNRTHEGKERSMIVPFIDQHARLCALLDDPRIEGLVGGLLGDDFNYLGSDGNYYVGDTAWHSDRWTRELSWVKVAFYLDPVGRETGCLRVIPGSHHPDHFVRKMGINVNTAAEQFGVAPSEFPGSIALESDPGDVVIFTHDLYHASFGGGKRRRMFTMNCTRHAKTPDEDELLREYLSKHSPGAGNLDTSSGIYFPTMLDTADEARMAHMWQPAQVHDEMFPHLARSNGDRVPFRGSVS